MLTAGVAALSLPARAQVNKNSKLRIFQIGVGGIGSLQRGGLKGHPSVEWAGFCDVDQRELDKISKEHSSAWTVKDYREGFAQHVADFDAVIVDVPDFHHTPMMMTALKNNKHIYGQKPLVHQLAELGTIREGLKAKPDCHPDGQSAGLQQRPHAVGGTSPEGQLGRPVEAYIWTGGVERGHYFADAWSLMLKPNQCPITWTGIFGAGRSRPICHTAKIFPPALARVLGNRRRPARRLGMPSD